MCGSEHTSADTPGSAGAPGESSTSKDSSPDHSHFDSLIHEIQELWEKQVKLEQSVENLKAYYQREYTEIVEVLQEEQCR